MPSLLATYIHVGVFENVQSDENLLRGKSKQIVCKNGLEGLPYQMDGLTALRTGTISHIAKYAVKVQKLLVSLVVEITKFPHLVEDYKP